MKAAIRRPAWVAMLVFGFCVGAPVRAQEEPDSKPKVNNGTKIAVVNLRVVFENYERVKALHPKVEKLEAYEKARKMHDGFTGRTSPDGGHWGFALTAKQKRQLDPLLAELNRAVEEAFDNENQGCRSDVNIAIQKVAEADGFQIVIAYGTPSLAPRILGENDAKRQDMAVGAVPAYVHGSVDITHAVSTVMSRWFKQATQQTER